MQEPFYNNETQTVMNNGCRDFYLGIYGGLGLMQAFSILILSVTLSITTLAGSRKLHRVLLDRVLKSPMGFFDTTPLGRIVNRYCTEKHLELPASYLILITTSYFNTTVKLGNKEQIGIKEPFSVTNLPFSL